VGAKLRGEGLFIELDDDFNLDLKIENPDFWDNIKREIDHIREIRKSEEKQEDFNLNPPSNSFRISKKKRKWLEIFMRRGFESFLNPLGIWWHTLSHRIIKALGLDCGYSSASLRERLYIDLESNRGAILIYANRPGEDGTLGGLVSQSSRFKEILKLALDDIDSCSNDPICYTQNFDYYTLNGAICYACGFLSETSCEFGNIGLDRNLLIDSL